MEQVWTRELAGTTFAVGAVLLVLVLVALRSSRSKQLKRLPPGPKPWPIIGNMAQLGPMSHESFAELSTTYGSPLIHMWLGSVHLVVANSIDTAKEILKNQDLNWASRPKSTASHELAYQQKTLSMSPHSPVWRDLRKVYVAELLTARRIRGFQPVRVEEIKEALRRLLQESNGVKAVSILSKVKEHLTNIVTSMLMSKRYFGSQARPGESEKFQQNIRANLVLLGVFHLGDYIPLLKYWDVQGNKKKMREAHASLDDFLQNVVDERRQELADKKNLEERELQEKGDFLNVLLTRSNSDNIELPDDRIKGILQDSIIGGVDSPANSVEWALAEVLRHPKILKQLRDELDREIGRERLVEEDDLSKLVYLQAVVKEMFRLHPVTPMLIPRLAMEACEIGGYHIPAGTQAFVNIWAIGTDPKVWENPFDFNPDRFVGNPIDVIGADFELLPFGSGRRKCPAINLGNLFVQYIFAVLIQSLDFSFPPGQTPDTFDMSEGVGIVNHRLRPVEAIVTARLPEHVLAPAA